MKVESKDTRSVDWFNDQRRVISCYIVLVFLGITNQGLAQKSLTSTQLLRGTSATKSSQLLQDNLYYLNKSNQGMPLVNKMEARTETDEFDFLRQEYLFRMSFNSKKARDVQNKITDNNIQFYELKSQIVEEAKLIDRYEWIVDWYYTQAELRYLAEEKILQKDKKTVYQKMLANSLIMNVDDLLKVEKEIQEIDRSVLQLNLKKEYLMEALVPSSGISDDLALDTTTWISLKTMAFVLAEAKDRPTSNLAQAIQQAKIDAEFLAFNMEKAENKQILDFAQIKYSGRPKLAFQREISLGVGFNIPTKSAARVKLNEVKLDIFDEEYKQQLQNEKTENDIAISYRNFNSLLKEYALIEQQIAESNLKETLENYSSTGTVHPLTLLRITASLLKDKQTLQDIEKEACLIFLEILLDKGLLSSTPKINYLSDTLNPF